MKTTSSALKILAAVSALLVATSCNPISKGAKSATTLIIQSVMGTTNDGTAANYLESSVTSGKPDTATITLEASLIDPNSPTGPSQYNSVTLTGYKINYVLLDGTGDPGVTVPGPISGAISSLQLTVGQSQSLSLIVVLDSAKLLAPLAALAGTTNKLQVNAQITIQGQDMSNNPVQATGVLSIIFGDYPATTPGL
jgi:hypothetical protein